MKIGKIVLLQCYWLLLCCWCRHIIFIFNVTWQFPKIVMQSLCSSPIQQQPLTSREWRGVEGKGRERERGRGRGHLCIFPSPYHPLHTLHQLMLQVGSRQDFKGPLIASYKETQWGSRWEVGNCFCSHCLFCLSWSFSFSVKGKKTWNNDPLVLRETLPRQFCIW